MLAKHAIGETILSNNNNNKLLVLLFQTGSDIMTLMHAKFRDE